MASVAIALTGLLFLQSAPSLSGNSPAGITSDEFDGGSLAPAWTFVNPLGDGSFILGGGAISITAPAGVNHDVWKSGVNAPRIMQSVSDGDFEIEAKFDSDVTQKFQLQGILVKGPAENYIRFGNYFNGSRTKAIVAAVNPPSSTQTIYHANTTSSSVSYLRLTRAGDLWTFERSIDGTNWTVLTSFSRVFTLAEIGVYAGNVGTPPHTAIVDYFRDTAVSASQPIAVDDVYLVNEDTTLNVAAAGVLTNDSDPEGDPLTAVIETGAANGAVTLNSDGSFSYVPDANFNGADSFTYTAADAGSSSTPATVSLTVNAVNDTPVATAQSVSTEQDTQLAVTLTGTDADNDPLTFAVVTGPANGVLSGTAPDLIYTPTPGVFGPDSFTFTASDLVSTSVEATVSITVFETNDAPVAFPDAYITDEDVVKIEAAPGVLFNDTDAEGDPLTAELVTGTSNGAVVLNADGSFSYTPNANYNGPDSFTYVARDASEASLPVAVALTVNPVNDAPVATPQAVSTDADTAVGITLDGTDTESDPLTYAVTTSPANGVITGTEPNITYTPSAGYIGPDSFEFTASDAGGPSTPATVTITVNSPGLLFSDEFDGTTLSPAWTFLDPVGDGTMSVGGGAVSLTAPGGTNHDVWSSGIAAPRIMQQVEDGDFQVEVKYDSSVSEKFQLQGILVKQDENTYLRIGNYYSGTRIKSIAALITLSPKNVQVLHSTTVTPSPTSYLRLARSGDLWTFERSIDGVNWTTLASFPQPFVVTEIGVYAGNVGVPAHTAVIDYFRDVTPVAATALDDAYGTDEDVTLNVSAPGVLANDTHPNGFPLTAVLQSGTSSGSLTLNADGSFTYGPNLHFNGVDSFTYRASDGTGSSNVVTVTLTINPINDVPVVQDAAVILEQDASVPVMLTGTDADNDPLTFTIETPPANGDLTGTAPNLTYTPDAGYFGPDSFTYSATDGPSTSNVGTVSITVFELNENPVAVNDAYSVDEDISLNVVAPGVLDNDTDLDGDPLTAELVTSTSNGSLTLNADGSFTYNPNSQFNGVDSFTYVSRDVIGVSPSATVTITVNSVNDAPIATPQAVSVDADVSTGITLGATDVENDPLTYVVTVQPTNGTLSGAAPNLVYTPDPGYIGSDSLMFTASDATDTSAPATVDISVRDPEDPIITFWYGKNQKFNNVGRPQIWVDVIGNVVDPDGIVSLSYTLNGGPSKSMGIGADARRLHKPGDFNVQLLFDELSLGDNIVVVTALDSLGNSAQETATLEYLGRSFWPENYSTDWSSAQTVQDAIQPVDGQWALGPGGLNNIGTSGYDRLLAIGDMSWSDYTATIPVTVHGRNPAGNLCCGLGIIIRWQGHTNEPFVCQQPKCGWEPYGNHVWYDWEAGGGESSAFANSAPNLQDSTGLVLQNGVPYFIKVEAETIGTDSYYRKKVWEQADPEPAEWMVEVVRNENSLPNGSLLLIAHHIDVTYGDIQITRIGTSSNSTPVAVDDSYVTLEDNTLNVSAPGILGNDTDAETDPLTVVLVSSPANGSLTIQEDGSFTYVPNANFGGSDSFSYRAADLNGTSNVRVVSLDVTPVNDVPTVEDLSLFVEKNTLGPATLIATDPDSGSLTYAITNPPTHGTLSGTAPNLTYTPDTDYVGPDSFTYTASDQTSTSTPGIATILVFQPTEAPVSAPDAYSVDEDVVLVVPALGVLANDTDPDGDPLTAELQSSTSNGALTLNSDGSFTYTPDAEFSGVDSFTYLARDAFKASAIVAVTITVNSVNDVPVAISQAVVTDSDVALAIVLTGTDIENDPLSFDVVTNPANGVLTGSAPNLVYTPAPGYIGLDSFTFTASDAGDTSPAATVDILVRDPGLILSDEFDGTSLSPVWTFVNPLGDGSMSVDGGAVSITSPGGINHDVWSNGVNAPRIMQQIDDIDFSVEAKFDSEVSEKFQLQGIIVRQADDTYLRIGNYYSGSTVKSIIAEVNPTTNSKQVLSSSTVTASATTYFRVTRVGDLWTVERSIDGTVYQMVASFTRVFTVSEIGVYAGNVGSPTHVSIVDYFRDVSAP